MPTRLAEWADLPAAAQLRARAFLPDPFHSKLLHPYTHLYPNDIAIHSLRSLRQTFFSPDEILVVTHPIGSRSTITGVAGWVRRGQGAVQMKRAAGWFGALACRLMSSFNKLHEWIWPNRAADPEAVGPNGLLARSAPFTKHYFEHPPRRLEAWHLNSCTVEPDFQGHGYGRELVEFGVDMIKRDRCCGTLIAANGKDTFYSKFGFVTVGWATEGEGNPTNDQPGGAVMICEMFSDDLEKEVDTASV